MALTQKDTQISEHNREPLINLHSHSQATAKEASIYNGRKDNLFSKWCWGDSLRLSGKEYTCQCRRQEFSL